MAFTLRIQCSKQISLEEFYFHFIDIAVRTSDPIVYTFLINEKQNIDYS
jgi:hypothetical protein